jgi:hypothetical protein
METDEIYKYIGYALVFLFIIYIISRTIQTNTRIIEGMKNKDKSTKKTKKGDEEDEEEPDDDEDWIDDAKDKIKEINEGTKKQSGYYRKHNDLYKELFVAKRKWLYVYFLNSLFNNVKQDDLAGQQATLTALKTQIDLLDFAIADKGGNSGGNKG